MIKKSTKLTNEYLYATSDVPQIPQEVIDERIRLLNENLERLLEVHWLRRDSARVNAVLKAINFWETINRR
jgi:hypothetical protein